MYICTNTYLYAVSTNKYLVLSSNSSIEYETKHESLGTIWVHAFRSLQNNTYYTIE